MDYRDERNALRSRVDSLESELASARAESERMAATEKALAAAQRENQKLRAEVQRLAPKPRKQGSPLTAAIVGGGVVVLITGGVAFLLLARSAGKPPVAIAVPGAEPEPLVVAAEGPTPAAEPEKSARATTVEWPARVTRSQGLAYPVGSACTLRATLRSDGVKVLPPDVEILCGGTSLYRSTDELAGMSTHSYAVEEVPGAAEGSYSAAIDYQDIGARTGVRAQASVSTFDHVMIAWKETAPTYRVELEIEELSAPWKGPALFLKHEQSAPSIRAFLRRNARVTTARDTPLVAKGDLCTIEARPAWGNEKANCRVRVQCGQTTLYGARNGGFNTCTAEGTSLLRANDPFPSSQDNDPRMDLRVTKDLLEVTDDGPSPWSVSVTLEPVRQ